jgi:hypothetical protein
MQYLRCGKVDKSLSMVSLASRGGAPQTTGAKWRSASWLALLAEAYGKRGQLEEGLTILIEALRATKDTGEHFYDAELHRLRGESLRSGHLNQNIKPTMSRCPSR